jgi:hypothetical protein
MNQKEQIKQLLSNAKALLAAMRYSTTTTSGEAANIGTWGSYKTFLRKYNALAKQAAQLLPSGSSLDAYDIDKIRGIGDTTWPEQKLYFDMAYTSTAMLKALLEGAIGYAEDEAHNLEDFIQARLRSVIFAVPDKEVEVQNAIEALMIGRSMVKGIDFDRETGRVKTSGKESIPDFVLPNLNLCLEVKLSKSTDKLRAIVDELNADIRAYSKLYERQLYVVYDVGTIRNEAEFKGGLEDAPGVSVIVVKH